MDQYEVIINNIRDIIIEMNKGTVYQKSIIMYCDKHKAIFNGMDHVYRCMRSLNITDELISKIKYNVYNTMLLWRELNLHVTSSACILKTILFIKCKILWIG